MRIGYVLSRFPVLSETFVQNEVEELERRGEGIVVFSLERPRDEKVHPSALRWREKTLYPPSGARLVRSVVSGHLRLSVASPRRWFSGVALGVRLRLWRLTAVLPSWALELRARRIEHMHVHFGFHGAAAAMLLGRWTGVPYSVLLHAADIFLPQWFLPEVVRRAAFVATGTEYNRKEILARHPYLAPERVIVNRYSVPPGRFESVPRRYREPGPPLRILSIGRLVANKGHMVLLQSLGALRADGFPFQARILGEGPQRAALEAERTVLGLEDHVELPGAVDEGEVEKALAWADVFTLACTLGPGGDRDGLPVVLIEAMMAALPVVTTDFIGIPELCGQGNTLLVAPDAPDALADALRRVGRMTAGERRELGGRARSAAVRMHDPERNVGQLLELWRAGSGRARGASRA